MGGLAVDALGGGAADVDALGVDVPTVGGGALALQAAAAMVPVKSRNNALSIFMFSESPTRGRTRM
jgi:hypothetical protein